MGLYTWKFSKRATNFSSLEAKKYLQWWHETRWEFFSLTFHWPPKTARSLSKKFRVNSSGISMNEIHYEKSNWHLEAPSKKTHSRMSSLNNFFDFYAFQLHRRHEPVWRRKDPLFISQNDHQLCAMILRELRTQMIAAWRLYGVIVT
jgi:hypothetical protein